MRQKTLCLLAFFLSFSSLLYANLDRGLSFSSHETIKDKRTSLHLTSDQKVDVKDYFSMEFDLRLRRYSACFGYVFRIILDETSSIDLLVCKPNDGELSYFLVADGIAHAIPIAELAKNKREWNHFKIELSVPEKKLHFSTDNKNVVIPFKLSKKTNLNIYFGVNQHTKFVSFDTPPFILKNVSLSLKRGKMSEFWALERHGESSVMDLLNGTKADVSNPTWMIDSHTGWKKVETIVSNSRIFSVFDQHQTLYLVNESTISSYNLSSHGIYTRRFSPKIPIANFTDQFIYNGKAGALLYYDLESKKPQVSYFDFEKSVWSEEIIRHGEPTHWHHNSIISPVDSSLIQLFGYGFHEYKADLKRFSFNQGMLSSQNISGKIDPRYLSAIGLCDSTLYVYGGIGNQSGLQIQGNRIYNDLYAINLNKLTITRLWDKECTNEGEIAAGSLVIEQQRGKALALLYKPYRFATSLQLNEIDLKNPELTPVADSIPFLFQDTESSADLFFSKSTSELYAVTIHKTARQKYLVNIYSISYPVINISETIQKKHFLSAAQMVLLFIFFAIATVLFFSFKRKRTGSTLLKDTGESETMDVLNNGRTNPRGTGIYLLGGFQVIAKDHRDITGEFTPVMKQMVALIILYTIKSEKGISNVRLKELFWNDKPEESARNNRSVNIRKIRLLLHEVGTTVITNENSYWQINFGEETYCDYIAILDLLHQTERNKDVDEKQIIMILSKVMSGQLLPNMPFEWFDQFKSDYTNLVIDTLTSIIEEKKVTTNHRLTIMLTEGILALDALNEEAVRIKCKSLLDIGRLGSAKSVFDRFINEYQLLLGEPFGKNFNQFVQQV